VLGAAARAWRSFPRLAAAALGSLLLQQLFFAGFAFSLKFIIDDVTTQHGRDSDLGLVLSLLLAGFGVTALATVTGELAAARAAALVVNGIRRELHAHLLRLSPAYFLTTAPAKVLNRFETDLKAVESGYVGGFLDSVVVVISAAITVPLLVVLDWRLALITIATLPVVLLAVDRLLPRSVDANDALTAAELETLNSLQDTVRAQQVVRTFHLERLFTRRFDELLAAQGRRSIRARVVAAKVVRGASLGVLFVQLVVIVVGAELAAHGAMQVSSLVAFFTVLSLLAAHVYDFARTDLPHLAEAGRSAQGLDAVLSAPVLVADPPDARDLQPVQGRITFDAVSFSYAPDRPALSDVSFEIAAGSSVAIVGGNGSGKSTVLNLLERFYDPQRGSIRVDGSDLREVSQRSLRAQLSVVLQANFIFNDTVSANIRIGKPEASDAEVVAAARQANLHDFVMTLPRGYDTMVGEAGGRLSGGQRQRLAIARALIREPRIILLDEVTTALDPGTEAAIGEVLARTARDRTMISVTHRLAAARLTDRILVFERGRLVEQGSHHELLAERGVYWALWEKQSGFEVSRDGRQASVDPSRLRAITLFAGLDHEALTRIALRLTSEYFEAGQTVFTQGDAGDRFFLIARGSVAVTRVGDGDDSEHSLPPLGDGDHFGELALLHDWPRTATIRTLTPSVFLTMSRHDLRELVATTPEITRALEQALTGYELNTEESRSVGRARPGAEVDGDPVG
jgi:ATP-binding cassette, subfamily B, bacterial